MSQYRTQGVRLLRMSSSTGTTAATNSSVLAFVTGANNTITRGDAGSFITDGFTTAMLVQTNSSANSTRILTPISVAATVITVNETVATQTSGATVALTGHVYSTIAEITNIEGPVYADGMIDITTLGSTMMERIPAVVDYGAVSLSILYSNFATAGHRYMEQDLFSGTENEFALVLSDQTTAANAQGSRYWFRAYVRDFAIEENTNDVVRGSVTLDISSAVRMTARI